MVRRVNMSASGLKKSRRSPHHAAGVMRVRLYEARRGYLIILEDDDETNLRNVGNHLLGDYFHIPEDSSFRHCHFENLKI
jgi:hypothetical protein